MPFGSIKLFFRFICGSAKVVSQGSRGYYLWLGTLLVLIMIGLGAYGNQVVNGLITSNMRDQVSWGFYIGNFVFLVGIAAAAVVLVIPAYVYNWGPIREVVLVGEILSIAAIVMCMLLVTVDVGRPELIWHMFPGLGTPNFPYSLLAWDIMVLNSYLLINGFIVIYTIFMTFIGRESNRRLVLPIILLSIPLAIGIHTVTAFLFMGLKARPFWNMAVLAPRFISSAFCSGPALMFLVFMVLRKEGKMTISNATLLKIGEFLGYAMGMNLFFLGVEVYTEFYSQTAHVVHARFQWLGIDGGAGIAIYSWTGLVLDTAAFVIFIVPGFRRRIRLLALGCVFAFSGVYIEKGMGLILPGLTPDTLGEVYRYLPSVNELMVGVGIWAVGALLFTLMIRVANTVNTGEFRARASLPSIG